MASDTKVNHTEYAPPKGLSIDEWQVAMIETKKGYSWKYCSFQPKNDEAKRLDYLGLLNQYYY